jgi:DNA-directed RNA polymerase specialized sigma24 family protein
MAGFPETRHSVIVRLRDADADRRREAFGDLVTGYWKPVYKHLRLTWHLADEDAQDVTQAFFSDAFQKSWLEKYEPDKARFRTFVRLCADRFVMNWKQAASRAKRGGAAAAVPLDFESAERELAAGLSTPPDAEEFFRQEFVRALFERAVGLMRREFEAAGRTAHLQIFDRYDLSPGDDVSYAELAGDLGLTTSQVTNYLALVRRSFRSHALDALASLTGSREEFRREAREIFGLEIE